MEIEFIEKIIKKEFPQLNIDDQRDLINTAWLFLAENNINQVSELSDELFQRLKKHLKSELNQINWREINIEDVSSKHSISSYSDSFSLSQEIETAALIFETQKENLRLILPPVLFEALHRKISPDAHAIWTLGFEDRALNIFCWRALIRIRWIR